MKAKLKKVLSVTMIVVVIFLGITAYYYFKTPSAAIVVVCDDFPGSLTLPFSTDEVIDRVVTHLEDMISTADSGVINELGRREGLGPRLVPQKTLPFAASSSVPSPVFSEKWKGMDLNLARRLGIHFKTKKLLELRVVGTSGSGWRVEAYTKERPGYVPHELGSAPRGGGQCSDLEACADDVAEQVLRSLDYPRLLSYYIKLDTENSNRQILDVYQNVVPAKSLKQDDFVAWGNAFLALGRYDDALEQYQEVLAKDDRFCPARMARGLVYNGRPHGSGIIADLRRAEEDFRRGVDCDSKNKFAQTNLCSTLLREWANQRNAPSQLLVEAQEHCARALEVDPRFAVAAVGIGYALYRQGKHEDALTYFDQIAQQHPNDSALFANYSFLAYLEYLEGKPDALRVAVEKSKKAFELNPESYAATNNLGFFYYEQQDYPDALLYWQKADPLRGDDADSTAGLALVLFKLNREPEALGALAKAIRANPHYHDPEYLKINNNWSPQAASDLAALIPRLSVDIGASVSPPCATPNPKPSSTTH